MDPAPERQGRPPRQSARTPQAGLDYKRIAAELGVSKSSVSFWVRDLPRPDGLGFEERRERCAEKTIRKNTGNDYHGCLRMDVRRSSHLCRKIEAWAAAAMAAAGAATLPRGHDPNQVLLPGEDSNLGRWDQNP